jgi:branched-chain amino acid transport system ATP-binding protein
VSGPVDARVAALRAETVSVRFGGVAALTDVSIEVRAGERVGVIGPNGAGKTTLFDVISGLRRPTAGRVQLLGRDVTKRSASWRARHGLRRTFQRQQVFGALTVRENLLVAQEGDATRGGVFVDLLGLSERLALPRQHERVDVVLEECGLTAVRDVPAASLPIGVARMVELGRALVNEPQLLLLDEPTSGLGEAETALMAATLRRYTADHVCGVLLVEHDVGFVMEHSDRVVVLNLGRVLTTGTPDEIRNDQSVRDAYLG